MDEATVVWSLKNHLLQQGLGPHQWSVLDVAVDSDGSYRRSLHAADLEPMLSMPIMGFQPDLVCAYMTSGLFLVDPHDIDLPSIPSAAFNPSFVFQFKQVLWHAGILATPIHRTAGHGAIDYCQRHDMWQMEDRVFQTL
jgi:hypothetical protein